MPEAHCTSQVFVDAGRSFTVIFAVGLFDIYILIALISSNRYIHNAFLLIIQSVFFIIPKSV